MTVIPPSPRSYASSLQSDRDSVASAPAKEHKERSTRNRPPSLANLDSHPSSLEADSGMPTPTPASNKSLVVTPHARSLTPSSSTGNLRDRVRSVVSRSSSRSRSRTKLAEPPAAPALPVSPSSHAAAAVSNLDVVADSHAQTTMTASGNGNGLIIVPPRAPPESITGTAEFQTSPTSAGAPTPTFRSHTVAIGNPAAFAESHFLTPDRVRDSDSISISSTASGRKRRLWRRSSTSSNSAAAAAAQASPKRKTLGLASALVASVSLTGSGSGSATSPVSPPRRHHGSAASTPPTSASSPRRKGSMVKRSPALSGHHVATSQSSVDSNSMQLSPPAIRSRHNSLTARPQDHESDYASSADGHDEEDDDDDSEDDELLAELNDGDMPVTGFAVASNKRNADFHELFRSIPEGDYLIEGPSTTISDAA